MNLHENNPRNKFEAKNAGFVAHKNGAYNPAYSKWMEQKEIPDLKNQIARLQAKNIKLTNDVLRLGIAV